MAQQRSLIRNREVRSRVGFSNTTIYEKIKKGTFPKPIRIGDRMVAWDSEAIDSWIEKTIEEGAL